MATGAGIGIAAAPAGLGSLIFRMEVDGFEPIRVSLSRFGERIRDFRPFWIEYFAPAFYRDVHRNFETQGGFIEGGWKPLSPAYARWKAQHYPGKTILRRTDALFRSLQLTGSTPGPDGIFEPDARSLVLGTAVAYARYLQRGTDRMVARPFLFIGRQARSTFGRLLHRFAVDQADEAGFNVAAARARGVTSGLL